MKAFAVALICAVAASGVAFAREANECIGAAGPLPPDFGLPHVAQAIADKQLDITVVGSASSELNGPGGTDIAYPVRMEATLRSLLPGVAVKVTIQARPRETAEEMEKKFPRIIADTKPRLVVWQTGTVDAIRGIDPDEFRNALDRGVDALRGAGVDLVFMNMQYSPRTEGVLAVGPYAETMRVKALQREVVLFDRLTIMKRWTETSVFDLYGATRNTDIAERVHDCLGRLLANVVVAASKLTSANRKATR
jgi:hypothetical protein